MKQFFKNKKVKIALLIIIPVLIIIGIFVSNYPLFYLSEVTVDRIDATHWGNEYELSEYKRYELCKALSTMNVGKRLKGTIQDNIVEFAEGSSYSRFKIKLCFNKSVYVGVHSQIPSCIIINDKYIYRCSKEDYAKIESIFNHVAKVYFKEKI